MSCGVGRRCGSDLALLWLCRRLAAVAPIRPLAWEPPFAAGVALKSKKKKKFSDRFPKIWFPQVTSYDSPPVWFLAMDYLQIFVILKNFSRGTSPAISTQLMSFRFCGFILFYFFQEEYNLTY